MIDIMHIPAPTQLLFLPGALGDTSLWQAVDQRVTHPAQRAHLGWPGFGPTPSQPHVQGFDDLVQLTLARIDQPTALIAQSMGGVVALRAALAAPEGLVTHLVLSVTSGGMDLRGLGAQDWRPALREAHPELPDWFSGHQEDLSAQLTRLTLPTLLLWGDEDPISPVAVGQRLAGLLPHAALHVLKGGRHDLAHTHADQVAPLIEAHVLHTRAEGIAPTDTRLDARLDRLLTGHFGLIPEPAHGGTWRNYFHQAVVREPAHSTRVLKVITDHAGQPRQLQLCASSDNNNAMLVPITDELHTLLPVIQAEIQHLKDKLART